MLTAAGKRTMAAWKMLPSDPDDSPHLARVAAPQQLLFPNAPRAVCAEMGLNWWTAQKLHEDGWLSFPPKDLGRMDEAQEAELRFVGGLVACGCDHGMLESLLRGLSKPYSYHAHRVFYDWRGRRWRLLPDPHRDSETVFTEWLERLVDSGDLGSLSGILELAEDGMTRARVRKAQEKFHHLPGSGSAGQGT